jgi:hypothetical protein
MCDSDSVEITIDYGHMHFVETLYKYVIIILWFIIFQRVLLAKYHRGASVINTFRCSTRDAHMLLSSR